jgi:hypothetical protein
MINLGSISIGQLIALFVVNAIGVVCFGLIFFLIYQKSPTPKTKLYISVGIGLIGIILLSVASGDLGIYLWIKSGNLKAAVGFLPLLICGIPLIFPVTIAGSYIQLTYRDKMQEYVDSASKKNLN